jgi:predicted amino acid racemase
MFLDVTYEKNPDLCQLALYYHQKGIISPNTYMIDIDAVRNNTQTIKSEADKQDISLYFMTKQFGRNPVIAKAVVESGITKAVAVDPWEALLLNQHNIEIGHVGHLVQIPMHMIEKILKIEPEVITVFSYENAKLISDQAVKLKKRQRILLRIINHDSFLYPGQYGGIDFKNLPTVMEKIEHLPGVEISGVTSFPCIQVNDKQAKPTPNLNTLQKANLFLQDKGYKNLQINTPSVSTTSTLKLLKSYGSTHAEPGHALTGTTPLHMNPSEPETPGILYVSEVSHRTNKSTYVYGGGFYPRSNVDFTFVGRKWNQLKRVEVPPFPADHIDYYKSIGHSKEVKVGDTALFAFRTQIFVTKANVVIVENIKSDPKILGFYDPRGNRLDG